MTPHELRNAIIENAASLRMYYENSAFSAIHNTARLVTEERLGQIFDRVESVIGPTSDAQHIGRQYLHHTAQKSLEALKVAVALYNHISSDLTVYDDINHIILNMQKRARDKHSDLLSIIVRTLQPVRKKFYSINELESSIGRVSQEALNSITKICLPDSDSADIKNVNKHLEEFFDSVPWVISTGVTVEWVKILIGYSNKVLNSQVTRDDIPALAQCLSLLMAASNILRIKHNMTASVGTDTLETSARYASNLRMVAVVKAEAALRNHEQCYPGLAQKIQSLLRLGDEIEKLKFYTGDSLLFFRGTQKYLVMLMHMFLTGSGTGIPQEQESYRTNLAHDPQVLLASMTDPVSYMRFATTVESSLPVSFRTYRMLYPTMPDLATLPNGEIPYVVSEFQDELRDVLTTVHCLDSLILRDFAELIKQHRDFARDHDCSRCSHILDTNVSYYVMEYLKLAVGALQRHTTHSLRHEECAIYISAGLLANVFAQGAVYKNLPKPSQLYQDICRAQAQFINSTPNTREGFLTYGHQLDQELMSCIFEIPINSLIGEHIANKRASITASMQTPEPDSNSYTGNSSPEQTAPAQPESPDRDTTTPRPQCILGSAHPFQATSDPSIHSSPEQHTPTMPIYGATHNTQHAGSEHRQWTNRYAPQAPRTVSGGTNTTISSHYRMEQRQQGISNAGIYSEDTFASTTALRTEDRTPIGQCATQHKVGYPTAECQSTSIAEPENAFGTTACSPTRIGNDGKRVYTAAEERSNNHTFHGASEWSVTIAKLQKEQADLREILASYIAGLPSASMPTGSRNAAISTDTTVFSHHHGQQYRQDVSSTAAKGTNQDTSLSSGEWRTIANMQENAALQAILDNSATKPRSIGATPRLSSVNVEEYLAQHGDSQSLFDDSIQEPGIMLAPEVTDNTEGAQTYDTAYNTLQQEKTQRLTGNEYCHGAIAIKITEQQTKIGTFVGTQGTLESCPTLNRVDAALEGGYQIVSSLGSQKHYRQSSAEPSTSVAPSSEIEKSVFAVPAALSRTCSATPAPQRTDSVRPEFNYGYRTGTQESFAHTVHFGIAKNQLQLGTTHPAQKSGMHPTSGSSHGPMPQGSIPQKGLPSTGSGTIAIRNTLGATASEFTINAPSTSSVYDACTPSGTAAYRTTTQANPCRSKATGTIFSRGGRNQPYPTAVRNATNLGGTKQSAPTSVTAPGYQMQSQQAYFTDGRSSVMHRYDNAAAAYYSGGADHGYNGEVSTGRGYSTTPCASVMATTPSTFNTHPKPSSSQHGGIVAPHAAATTHSVSNPLAPVRPTAVGTVIEPSSVTPLAAHSRNFRSNTLGNN